VLVTAMLLTTAGMAVTATNANAELPGVWKRVSSGDHMAYQWWAETSDGVQHATGRWMTESEYGRLYSAVAEDAVVHMGATGQAALTGDATAVADAQKVDVVRQLYANRPGAVTVLERAGVTAGDRAAQAEGMGLAARLGALPAMEAAPPVAIATAAAGVFALGWTIGTKIRKFVLPSSSPGPALPDPVYEYQLRLEGGSYGHRSPCGAFNLLEDGWAVCWAYRNQGSTGPWTLDDDQYCDGPQSGLIPSKDVLSGIAGWVATPLARPTPGFCDPAHQVLAVPVYVPGSGVGQTLGDATDEELHDPSNQHDSAPAAVTWNSATRTKLDTALTDPGLNDYVERVIRDAGVDVTDDGGDPLSPDDDRSCWVPPVADCVRVPAPTPHETYHDYAIDVAGADLAPEPHTLQAYDPHYGPREVVMTRPRPTTTVHHGADVDVYINPATAPSPGTGGATTLDPSTPPDSGPASDDDTAADPGEDPGGDPGEDPDDPGDDDGDDGGGPGAIDLSPLAAVTPCTKFPFGVPCWINDAFGGWDSAGEAPVFDLPIPYWHTSWHVDFAVVQPVVAIIRPLLLLGAMLGLGLFFMRLTGGFGGGGGGSSDDDDG
jgi:hypothetical protein